MTTGVDQVSRRSVIQGLAVAIAGLTGCTPIRFLIRPTAPDLAAHPDRIEAVLRGFVDVVMPGCEADRPEAIRALDDDRLPFASYRSFFASDLCSRSETECGDRWFEQLPRTQRTRVVAAGLAAGGLTRQLYTGAIFLTQIAVMAGIYDDRAGAPLIDFDGVYRFRGLAALSYPDPERFLPPGLTASGHYH